MGRKKWVLVLMFATALFQVAGGVSLADGPITINNDTFGGLDESNQTLTVAKSERSVWVGSFWAGYPVNDQESVAGPPPFYEYGQQHVKVSYYIENGKGADAISSSSMTDLGWSDWHNPVLEGNALQIEIPYDSDEAGKMVVDAELRESDCNNFGGLGRWVFRFGARKPRESGDSPWSSIYFHSEAAILEVFRPEHAADPWNHEHERLGEARTNNDFGIGNGWKTSFAESQEFVVFEYDEATGAYDLFGYGKVLAGSEDTWELWPDGDEASVIGTILWIPVGAIEKEG